MLLSGDWLPTNDEEGDEDIDTSLDCLCRRIGDPTAWGSSKSHETPCFKQLPQVGWISSHCPGL